MSRRQTHTGFRENLRAATALIALAAFAVACTTPTLPPPVPERIAEYQVGPPDTLSVTVLPEPALEIAVTVRPDGRMSLPLIGEVNAGGRTIPDIEKEIEQRMAKYKRGAQVSVALTAAQSTDISIIGEVFRPGAFPLVKSTRIVEALATVGGTTSFGWDSRIRVIRVSEGQSIIHRVDLGDISDGDQSTNILMEPGDIVYVPPTPWAVVGYAIQAVLFPFQPLLGVAKAAGGSAIAP